MKKLYIFIVVLITLLILVSVLFSKAIIDLQKKEELLTIGSNDLNNANNTINILQRELNNYKDFSVTTNTTNTTNIANNKPYIPNNMTVDTNENITTTDLQTEFNRIPEKVIIEVLEDTITRQSATILITDNNVEKYGWGNNFRLQKKVNDIWKEIKEINELNFIAISYQVDENNHLKLDTNYGDYYGELKDGIYRIVKSVYDNGYIDLYSNEFEIK